MNEEQKLLSGMMYRPADPTLRALKLKAHNLNIQFNQLFEDQAEERMAILKQLVGSLGEGSNVQGPIYFHYGSHTKMGARCFANFNFTVQDDASVTIGDDVYFGPNCTLVTPLHPLIPEERVHMKDAEGNGLVLCYAKPIVIGNKCWFGANVTVCPGVTIGEGCVIGAGSVVTKDIPPRSVAMGVPCNVVREITEADSMKYRPELLGDYRVAE